MPKIMVQTHQTISLRLLIAEVKDIDEISFKRGCERSVILRAAIAMFLEKEKRYADREKYRTVSAEANKRRLIKMPCYHCKLIFSAVPYSKKSKRFCSPECYADYQKTDEYSDYASKYGEMAHASRKQRV